MKKMINRTRIEGYVYDHKLTKKESGPNSKNPGTVFISGILSVATDNAALNIVDVHFTYVTATTGKGQPNGTFKILDDIINGTYKTVMSDGQENAVKVRIDSAFGLNEWYGQDDQLVSVKRNEGGFVHVVNGLSEDENSRNTFEVDVVITGTRTQEADPDRDLPEKLILDCRAFNFRNDLLPMEFSVINPNGIGHFESLEYPIFTKIKGNQVSSTIVRTIVEEGAFGDSVREVTSNRKDCVVTWTMKEPYAWDDEETITVAQLNELKTKRETDLATLKQRQEEYQAQASAAPAAASTTPSKGGFNF